MSSRPACKSADGRRRRRRRRTTTKRSGRQKPRETTHRDDTTTHVVHQINCLLLCLAKCSALSLYSCPASTELDTLDSGCSDEESDRVRANQLSTSCSWIECRSSNRGRIIMSSSHASVTSLSLHAAAAAAAVIQAMCSQHAVKPKFHYADFSVTSAYYATNP